MINSDEQKKEVAIPSATRIYGITNESAKMIIDSIKHLDSFHEEIQHSCMCHKQKA